MKTHCSTTMLLYASLGLFSLSGGCSATKQQSNVDGDGFDIVEEAADTSIDGDDDLDNERTSVLSACECNCRDGWELTNYHGVQTCRSVNDLPGGRCSYGSEGSSPQECPDNDNYSCIANGCVLNGVSDKAYLYTSNDGGCSWRYTSTWSDVTDCTDIILSEPGAGEVLCAHYAFGVTRHLPDIDGQSRIESLESASFAQSNLGYGGAWYVTGDTPRVVYWRSAYGETYRSLDHGDTWQQLTGLPDGQITSYDGNGLHIMAVFYEDGLQRSEDGGANWSPGRDQYGLVPGFTASIGSCCTSVTVYGYSIAMLEKKVYARLTCRDPDRFVCYDGVMVADLGLTSWKKFNPDYVQDVEPEDVYRVYASPHGSLKIVLFAGDPDGSNVYLSEDISSFIGSNPPLEVYSTTAQLADDAAFLFYEASIWRWLPDENTPTPIEMGLPTYVTKGYYPIVRQFWIDPDNPTNLTAFVVWRSIITI